MSPSMSSVHCLLPQTLCSFSSLLQLLICSLALPDQCLHLLGALLCCSMICVACLLISALFCLMQHAAAAPGSATAVQLGPTLTSAFCCCAGLGPSRHGGLVSLAWASYTCRLFARQTWLQPHIPGRGSRRACYISHSRLSAWLSMIARASWAPRPGDLHSLV